MWWPVFGMALSTGLHATFVFYTAVSFLQWQQVFEMLSAIELFYLPIVASMNETNANNSEWFNLSSLTGAMAGPLVFINWFEHLRNLWDNSRVLCMWPQVPKNNNKKNKKKTQIMFFLWHIHLCHNVISMTFNINEFISLLLQFWIVVHVLRVVEEQTTAFSANADP